jgi:hypothetical protein
MNYQSIILFLVKTVLGATHIQFVDNLSKRQRAAEFALWQQRQWQLIFLIMIIIFCEAATNESTIIIIIIIKNTYNVTVKAYNQYGITSIIVSSGIDR